MTITTSATIQTYAGDDATSQFSIPFWFITADDVAVALLDDATLVVTELTDGVDFIISGDGEALEGIVDLYDGDGVTPLVLASGLTLIVYRYGAITQEFDFSVPTNLVGVEITRAIDHVMGQIQELWSALDQIPKFTNVLVAEENALDEITYEAAADREGKIIVFDASGQPVLMSLADAIAAYG